MVTRVLGVLGVILLIATVALGFQSIAAAGGDCGSTFQPADGITPLDCDVKLSDRSTAVAVVGGLGLVAVVAAITLTVARERRESSA